VPRRASTGRATCCERWYLQYLHEKSDVQPTDAYLSGVSPSETTTALPPITPDTTESLALGVSWDWPVVRGSGFQTKGHSHRAWIFTSNTAWGSDLDFSQSYLASRWSTIRGDRWKFLLRGEIGYSDARVVESVIDTDQGPAPVSITRLPYTYRFKAGGSQSVRGYGFESLSDNNIGSNHIITASAEIEFKFRENWSAAVFFDLGNAFNDWSNPSLKKGAGVGIRWYSIAGPIRFDVAQAMDEPGKPWRFHFTIGSPLL
jgi:translocation and assembly module TamA